MRKLRNKIGIAARIIDTPDRAIVLVALLTTAAMLALIAFPSLSFGAELRPTLQSGKISASERVVSQSLRAESLVYPLVGTRVSSRFGMRVHPVIHRTRHHHGLDLAAPSEAPVRAIQKGTVVYADPHGGYGNLIVIQHDDGITSHYGHLHSMRARPGMRVSTGQVIGAVGSTGRVTGPHLHFEVRKSGKPLDPLTLFPHIAKQGEG